MFGRKRKNAEIMPERNQSVSEWQKWIEVSHWKKVFDAWQNFKPRGYAPYKEHDMQIVSLLENRLMQIEFPICGNLPKDVNKLVVPNDVSLETLKKLVETGKKQYPYVVVEQSGLYRGVAVSPNLIFAGTNWLTAVPQNVARRAKQLGVEFLTQADSLQIEKHWNEINNLLDVVGVPTFRDIRYWLLAPIAKSEPYEIWKLSERGRRCQLSEKMPTHLFVKL